MTRFSVHLVALLLFVATGARAGSAHVPAEFGGTFAVPTVSLKEARFSSTLRQKYDFSCGSAALATLLTHHYNYPVTEQQVFEVMYEHGDRDKIRQQGFSLLDMKLYLNRLGFQAEGRQGPLETLLDAKVPGIVLVKENGYLHFVVVKGIRDGQVLVGDPATGTRIVPRAQFDAMWANNILFLIRNRIELAQFNSEQHWRVRAKAPLADGLNRGAFDLAPLRRGSMDF